MHKGGNYYFHQEKYQGEEEIVFPEDQRKVFKKINSVIIFS